MKPDISYIIIKSLENEIHEYPVIDGEFNCIFQGLIDGIRAIESSSCAIVEADNLRITFNGLSENQKKYAADQLFNAVYGTSCFHLIEEIEQKDEKIRRLENKIQEWEDNYNALNEKYLEMRVG